MNDGRDFDPKINAHDSPLFMDMYGHAKHEMKPELHPPIHKVASCRYLHRADYAPSTPLWRTTSGAASWCLPRL
jgi:hypothetical protein